MDRENVHTILTHDRLTHPILADAKHQSAKFSPRQRQLDALSSSQAASRPVQMVYPAVQKTSHEMDASSEMGNDAVNSDSSGAEEGSLLSDGSDPSCASRRRRSFVPDDHKNANYWMKRIKNNLAAKRSREKRRIADIMLESKVSKLAQENEDLKSELASIKQLVTERLVTGRHQEGLALQARPIPDQSDLYVQVHPVKRARYLNSSAPHHVQPSMNTLFPHQISQPYNSPPSRLQELPTQLATTAHPTHTIPSGYLSGGAAVYEVPFYPRTQDTRTPLQHPWGTPVQTPFRSVHPIPKQSLATNHPTLPIISLSSNVIAADLSTSKGRDEVKKDCVPGKYERSLSANSDSPPKSTNNELHISTVSPPTAAEKTTCSSPVSRYSEGDTISTSPSSNDTMSLSSPSPSDQQSRLSPTEINKLPHKLRWRTRMLRAMTESHETPQEPNLKDDIKDDATYKAGELPTAPSCNQPSVNAAIPRVVKIKEERVDDDDATTKGCGQWNASSVEATSVLRLLQPKEEFPVVHPRSVEEEIEQARGLLDNPVPPQRRSADEMEAYAGLLTAATALISARLQAKDFYDPTLRQLSRQRTRGMNDHDKYRDKRARNNIAAKKCRDAKRLLMDYRAARSSYLEFENVSLHNEMETLSKEIRNLRELLKARDVSQQNSL